MRVEEFDKMERTENRCADVTTKRSNKRGRNDADASPLMRRNRGNSPAYGETDAHGRNWGHSWRSTAMRVASELIAQVALSPS